MEYQRILVIKTSSLGDVVHCLIAVNEAKAKLPQLQIDWVVEQSFADIVKSSSAVDKVFAIEFRQWRKKPLAFYRNPQVKAFLSELRQNRYDLIIDAQGLLKSAFLALHAKGRRVGFAKQSAREPLASLAYQQKIVVDKAQHAIERQRQLFANALGYELTDEIDIDATPIFTTPANNDNAATKASLIFLHGTTWQTKKLPLRIWQDLLKLANADGYQVELFYGNDEELAFAQQLASSADNGAGEGADNVLIHHQLSLPQIIQRLQAASGVISVDTGLAHIANALNLPMVMLFGPTKPALTGANGRWAKNLQADGVIADLQRHYAKADGNGENPYMSAFCADTIYQQLQQLIRDKAL